jgi:CubicO group peptidase (beta-lactamase class C family)
MQALQDAVDEAAARTGFSGVVRVDRSGETEIASAYGFADRAHRIRNTVETQFGIASGTKGLTALAVMSLVERETFGLGTTARSLLGDDLPLIADDVTIERLLAHRSGIGDYLDESAVDAVSDYVMPVPVHQLATTEQFVSVLGGHETVFPAGERFAYNNGGYVLLALLAERASGVDFHRLVRERVCEPAGMVDSEFLRSDELPGRAALGYLFVDGLRTNVLHLPVLGTGDGGHY